MKSFLEVSSLLLTALAAVACGEQGRGWQFPQRANFQGFSEEVMPVLLRDCGFHACHGSSERFYRVWGPGRVRLDPMTRPFDPLTGFELDASYNLAASMVDVRDPGVSLLLRKPLALAAGGAVHRGGDAFGRNVYRSTGDQGYVVLLRWVESLRSASSAQ
jgi:hypothetical protein